MSWRTAVSDTVKKPVNDTEIGLLCHNNLVVDNMPAGAYRMTGGTVV
jgi:hypothetical protein